MIIRQYLASVLPKGPVPEDRESKRSPCGVAPEIYSSCASAEREDRALGKDAETRPSVTERHGTCWLASGGSVVCGILFL